MGSSSETSFSTSLCSSLRSAPRNVGGATSTDSDVRHHGAVRFAESGDGGTRVSVELSYIPPAGAFGHAVAAIFGADPKSEMDADLLRMTSVIETGHPPHDAAKPGALPRES